MPSRYRRDAQRLKAEIVGRVAAGERLGAVCATPGLPGGETARAWARADAAFGEALEGARAQAAARRLRFDEAQAAAFLARARAGEAINALLREAGMPRRRAYRYWCATQAPFAEAVFALRQRRDQEIGRRGRARFRAWDEGLGDRIIVAVNKGLTRDQALAADPALPSRPTVRRWRREQPRFDAVLRTILAARRRRTARGLTPDLTERIIDRIVEGASFNSLSREPGMPSRQTLRRWIRVRPDFGRAVARACKDREDWFCDQIEMIAEAATPGTVKDDRRRMVALSRQLGRLRHRPGAVHRKTRADGGANRLPLGHDAL
ncbi:MAG TPA: hypothetical protein VHN73_06505 [Phenylobacterium sp.]|nr:hypothetical protein [Phenylobacterium sp.]